MKKALFSRFMLASLLAYTLPTNAFDVSTAPMEKSQAGARTDTAIGAWLSAPPSVDLEALLIDAGGVTDAEVTPVPEPEAYSMLVIGIGLIAFMSRRKRTSDKLC